MATLIVIVGRRVMMVMIVATVLVVVLFVVMVVVVILVVVVVVIVIVIVVVVVVVVEVAPLLLRTSEAANAFLGDGGDAFAAEGFRLHLHDEGARTALLALAPGTRVRPVFGVAFVGAHSDRFLAADWERTVLHADAHARAQLAFQRGFFYGSPVALGFEGLQTAVAVSGTSVAARTGLDGFVFHQRTHRVLGARLRQQHAFVVSAFAFLARMFGGGGVAICFRPSIGDGARNPRALVCASRKVNFFWFFKDWEIVMRVLG